MKSSDRAVLLGLGIVGLAAAFWFMVLSPKRAEVSELDQEIATLEASVAEAEQTALAAEQAQTSYDANYSEVVVLGKAVPSNGDSASLVEQTAALSKKAGIEFRGLTLAAAAAADQVAAPAAEQTTTDQAEGEESADGETAATPAAVPAPATEAAAATLPIGAAVGPAGLPTMPYDLSFRGDFFGVADYMAGLDSLVQVENDGIGVDGRLLTVDGFTMKPDEVRGYPYLEVDMHVTSFVTPADQGVTAGASPAAPASTTPPSTPVAAPAATVTP